MIQYHKIQTVFKRDRETKFKTLLNGQYSLPEFEYLKNTEWHFTEKIDGTNIRVIFDKDEITFGGKTDNAQIPAPLINALNKLFLPQLELFKEIFKDASICLYGEGYGAKIQKVGGHYRSDQGFVLFDIKIDGWWLDRYNIEDIARQLNIDVVPAVGRGTLEDMIKTVRTGFNSRWGHFKAEGIVARPKVYLSNRKGDRIITKLKYRDFN